MLASAVLLLSYLGRADQTINVFAAASLKEAFTTIATSFEKSHDGIRVNLNFGGSQMLAAQINGGAPADVFASADQRNLSQVKYIADSRRIFAQNRLQIILRSDLQGILSPRDLRQAGTIVIADEAVPVGNYTNQFLTKASKKFGASWIAEVKSRIASKEQDVKAVLAKVKLGEADAGIVYVSDAMTAHNSIRSITIPDELNVRAEYPAAVPSESPNPRGGSEFIGFLLTMESQTTLGNCGFQSVLTKPKRKANYNLVASR